MRLRPRAPTRQSNFAARGRLLPRLVSSLVVSSSSSLLLRVSMSLVSDPALVAAERQLAVLQLDAMKQLQPEQTADVSHTDRTGTGEGEDRRRNANGCDRHIACRDASLYVRFFRFVLLITWSLLPLLVLPGVSVVGPFFSACLDLPRDRRRIPRTLALLRSLPDTRLPRRLLLSLCRRSSAGLPPPTDPRPPIVGRPDGARGTVCSWQ